MAPRPQLQSILEGLVDGGHVYFQPPANVQMEYPCIVYQRDLRRTQFASNLPYRSTKRYQVTVISQDADDPICEKVASLPLSAFNRYFAVDNLHHDVYDIFF